MVKHFEVRLPISVGIFQGQAGSDCAVALVFEMARALQQGHIAWHRPMLRSVCWSCVLIFLELDGHLSPSG